jgi:hypothetical protein
MRRLALSALRELQTAFYAAMLDPAADTAVLERIEEDDDIARRRLAAYRDSIFGNLIGALAATYPVVERIVGAAFFREAARCFAESQPSVSGDLNDFGGEFGIFLAGYCRADALPYLADVARLEWLVQSVYYAADAPPADLAILATTPPDRLGELCFVFDPAHARLDSRWPLDAIWRVNADGYSGDMAIDLSCPCRLLILRHHGRVYVETVSVGEAALLEALLAGATLSAATTNANACANTCTTAAEASFDLGAALQRFIGAGLLLGASLGPTAVSIGHSHD